MQPLSDLLTALMNMSLVLRLPREMHLCRTSSNVPRLPTILKLRHNPHVFLTFGKLQALALATKSYIQVSKSAPRPPVFYTFWLRNVLRAKAACTFWTSPFLKGSEAEVFCKFWRFAPQQRTLFRYHNFQKWSDVGVFCTFWLRRATTACNFASLIWPHGSAPAALASLLFNPPEPQIIGKNTVFRDFATFSFTCTFFLLILSPLWSSFFCSSLLWLFPPLLFHLSMLSEVWLPNFPQ